MKRDKIINNYNALPRKILYSIGIVCLYIMGRNIPMPWIVSTKESADSMFEYTASILGTDVSKGSLFSLGISPWITSKIIIQLLSSLFRSKDRIISKTFFRRIELLLTILMSVIQSISLLGQVSLRENAFPYMWLTEIVTIISLIGGTFVIIVLSESITENGIAGASALILVNILTTFRNNLISYLSEPQWTDISRQKIVIFGVIPAVYMILIVFFTTLFEKSEFRIPVYRVMINNDLADETYIAIRLNPAGTMPVMFAMTFFMVPYYMVDLLLKIWHDQPVLVAIKNAFSLDNYIGIILYLLMTVFLNYAFSFVMINPTELTKQYMEGGDCIAGLRPGKETLKYIKKCIRFCLVPSSIMLCTLVGSPLFIKVASQYESKLFQLPITIIILTSICLNIFEEIRVIRNFRDYKAFL